MPQVCGIQSLFPSDTLFPSDSLAPGSGAIFVPTLPLQPSDFPIDDSAAAFVATEEVISLSRFYAARFFNDLPEWFQGLPLPQLPGVPPLPEYVNDPDNIETKHWGVQRIILRALAREMARIDYVLRGRVSLAEYELNRRFPHATPADDRNVFELIVREGEPAYIEAPATFVNPASVLYGESELRTNRLPAYAEGSGPAGLRYIFTRRINDIQTWELVGAAGGDYTLSLRGETTQAIDWNETDPNVIRAQIAAFSFVADFDPLDYPTPGTHPDFIVEYLGASKWRFEWRGPFAGTDIAEFTSTSNLVGADPLIDHVTEQDGNAGFFLTAELTNTPPSDDYKLIGDASWDGTEFLAVVTYPTAVGGIDNGRAYYNPYLDPQANNDVNPACTPLSQNEGLAPQMMAVTANWALDLWEATFGLEVPSKNPINTIQYPERRARLLRAELGVFASKASEYSYLAAERAKELGITIGEFEEALYTDPDWDNEDFVIQALDEVQFLQLNNATGGNFAVSLDEGDTWSAAIPWNASDATFESIVQASLSLAGDDFTVEDQGGGRFWIYFGGQFSGVNMPRIAVDTTGLTGLTAEVATDAAGTIWSSGAAVPLPSVIEGAPPSTNEVQRLRIRNTVGGYLPLTWDSQTTVPVAYAATPAEMKDLFDNLLNLTTEDIAVAGLEGQLYDFTFQGALAATDVSSITVDTTQLIGTPATVAQGTVRRNLETGQPGDWRGRDVVEPAYGVPLEGDPAESTYPWYLWVSVFDIEGLSEDPLGAKARLNALRDYLNDMTPAHLQVGFDFGAIGGFIVDISLVGIDRV